MYMTLTTSQAADMLMQDSSAGWSYNGAMALVERLNELYEDDYNLDVVALRCEFSEYDSATDAAEEYGWEADEDHDDEEREAAALMWLQERTTVIEFAGGVIVGAF